jgi:ferrochelatase
MSRRAVLLVNLGSPNSASVSDIRKYLREFLMDGRVLDAPYPVRFGIVHFMILPWRPKKSAEAYEKIWTAEGSPLVVTSRKVQADLQQRLGIPVELAMRYQNPSIDQALEKLRAEGVKKLLLIPMFPHYAMSSYETAVERVASLLTKISPEISLSVIAPFYEHPDYISALVGSAGRLSETIIRSFAFQFSRDSREAFAQVRSDALPLFAKKRLLRRDQSDPQHVLSCTMFQDGAGVC